MRKKLRPLCPSHQCSRMLYLSRLDRVHPAGRSKVFIWRRIVGPARRVSLPTSKRDLLTRLAETIRACASTVGSGKGVGSEVDPTRG